MLREWFREKFLKICTWPPLYSSYHHWGYLSSECSHCSWRQSNGLAGHYSVHYSQKLFNVIRGIYGPLHKALHHPVRSKDDTMLIKEHQTILSWQAKHLKELFTHTRHPPLDELLQLPTITDIDVPPTYEEVYKAVKELKITRTLAPMAHQERSSRMVDPVCWKGFINLSSAPGSPEMFRSSGRTPTSLLSKNAKGRERADWNNSRGISLFNFLQKSTGLHHA